MILQKPETAKSIITKEPFIRELKVFVSPFLQKEVTEFSVGMTVLPPGNSTSNHEHDAEVEAWLVIKGTGEAIIGGETAEVGPETVIYVLPNTMHQMVNTGNEEMKFFWVYSPPGSEKVVLDGTMT